MMNGLTLSGAASVAVDPGRGHFDAAHRALALFAQAIGQRPVRLAPSSAGATSAWLRPMSADSAMLAVATGMQGLGSAADHRAALRIAVMRETLRGEAPGFSSAVPPPRPRHPLRPPPPAPDHPRRIERRLFGLLERMRVDAVIERHYPGARTDLARVQACGLALRGSYEPRSALAALIDGLARASLGEAGWRGQDDGGHLLTRMLSLAATVRRPGASARDCAETARRIAALLDGFATRPRPARKTFTVTGAMQREPGPQIPGDSPGLTRRGGQGADEDEDDSDDTPERGRGRTTPESADDAALKPAGGKSKAASESAAGGAPATSDTTPAESLDDDGASEDEPLPGAGTPARWRAGARSTTGTFLYDEWHHLERRYLLAWCRVHEHRLRGTDFDFAQAVRKRYPDLMRDIRHRFAQLRPMAPRRVRGVASGDDIDLEGMVAAVIDRRSGSASDDRLHVRRDPLERDVAAAFLLDMSASTSLALPEAPTSVAHARDDDNAPPVVDAGTLLYGVYGSPPDAGDRVKRRRVIDVAKDSLALMAEGLATLGDAHAIYGFSGSGRDNVEFHIAKEFGEPVRRAVWAALAAIEPRGSTRMGPAIRHAAAKLARQPSPLRLLILVSDGYPQDIDYGPDRNSEEYGIQDTAQALREAERAGIATFCVTIDPGGHDYLRRMCSPERYRVIDDVAALPAALGEIYAGLTSRGG
jgi:hypothetical protein